MSRRALLNQSLTEAAEPSPGVWRMAQTVLTLYLGCTPRPRDQRSRSR
ncbi:hypothetical protein ACFPIF_05365 [Brevundimonas faecalis]